MRRDEPVDGLNNTGSTDTIYKKLEHFIESQPRRAKINAFSKTKVNLSAARELEEEKKWWRNPFKFQTTLEKVPVSAKKLNEIFVFRLLTLVFSIVLRKQE